MLIRAALLVVGTSFIGVLVGWACTAGVFLAVGAAERRWKARSAGRSAAAVG